MFTPVQLPLAIDRGAPRIYTILLVGIDLGGGAWSGSIRLQPDSPSAIVDLPKVTDATSTGVRLVSTGIDEDGVTPLSWLRIQLPAMNTGTGAGQLPPAGELGDVLSVYWDFFVEPEEMTASRLFFGPVAVNPTATKADPPYELRDDALVADATVTIIGSKTTLDVSAASALAPLVKAAQDAVAQTAADVAAASLAATAAAGFVNGIMYASTTAGLAATNDGQYFTVRGDGTNTYAILYLNDAGVAVEQARYASKAAYEGAGGAALIGATAYPNVEAGLAAIGTKAPIAGLPTNGTGTALTALGAFHNFPATPVGGDDGPNVVLGSAGAVDMPADCYGNIVAGMRNNNVSGGVGYRNRLLASTCLSVVLGGDNDVDCLAAQIMGHHHRADTTGGAQPSHVMMRGSGNTAGGDHSLADGVNHDVWAHKAAAVGGDGTRIGTQGSPNNARNTFAAAGYQLTADGSYALVAGQLSKAQKDYTVATGYGGVALNIGDIAHSAGYWTVAGDQQVYQSNPSRIITGAVATALLYGGAAGAPVGGNLVERKVGRVTAVRTDVLGEYATWDVDYEVSTLGGAATITRQSITPVFSSVATGGGRNAWVLDLVVASGRVDIRVKGEGAPITTLRVNGVIWTLLDRAQ